MTRAVLRCATLPVKALDTLVDGLGLAVQWWPEHARIPGTYWGEPEAGRIGATLHVRGDTPVHSALHESAHYACMDARRRAIDAIDAGGSALEECAVCYLQVLLADRLPGVGRARMLSDMDAWGYSFRLGSARAWFEQDAEDARAFLVRRGLAAFTDAPGG